MKVITYEYSKMMRAGQILMSLQVSGIAQARLLSELGEILDNGTLGEVTGKEHNKNGMESKKI